MTSAGDADRICMKCGETDPYEMMAWRLDQKVWVPWCPLCVLKEGRS